MLAQAGADGRLTRRGLAQAGRQDAAHVDLLDLGGIEAGAFDRRLDRRSAQLGRLNAVEGTLEAAHGRAGEGDDDDGIGHGDALVNVRRM